MPTGTQFKLRICTWNVGNAPPPADLTSWLGTDTENFDIIVIGAQEANFGVEKPQSPMSISSPISNTDIRQIQAIASTATPVNVKLAHSKSSPTPSSSSKLRKISNVVRVAVRRIRPGTRQPKAKVDEITAQNTKVNRMLPSIEDNEPALEHRDSDMGQNPLAMSSQSLPLQRLQVRFEGHDFENASSSSSAISRRTNDDENEKGSDTEPLGINRALKFEDERFNQDGSGMTSPDLSVSTTTFHDPANEPKASRSSTRLFPKLMHPPPIDNSFLPASPRDLKRSPVPIKSPSLKEPVLRRLLTGHRYSTTKERARSTFHSLSQVDDGILTRAKKFSQAVENNMPLGYQLVVKHHLMEIKLLIYVHERLVGRVVRTERTAEATGLGNFVGNKGGVAAKLTLDDTTFCFVCSHLAAHEGAKYVQQRHDDVIEIMRNLSRNKNYSLPPMQQYNHVFWLGDLNYRLDVKRVVPAATHWSHEQKWAHVVDLIERGRYKELAGLDELIHEIKAKRIFVNFSEGDIDFAPTFKVCRGKDYCAYQPLRVPSYCDRVLWHSMPAHRSHVRIQRYESVAHIDSSDHKPVFAEFDVVIPPRMIMYPVPGPRDCFKCTLDFKRIRLDSLYAKGGCEPETRYQVLEDGALAVREDDQNGTEFSPNHTRRLVHAWFFGHGAFVRERGTRVEIGLRNGIREARYEELPKIALMPVRSLSELMYKYVSVVFTRLASRNGSGFVIGIGELVKERKGKIWRGEVGKWGGGEGGNVEVEVELVISLETWIDAMNRVVKPKR